VYPAGRNVVLYDAQKKFQRFVAATPSAATEAITAMAVCPNRRYAAFAQRGERPSVTVFDIFTLKRRDDLVVPEPGQARDFVALAFSPDGKTLVAQSGAPDWNLYCWAWEKAKLVAAVKSGTKGEGALAAAGASATISSV
jgi:hypothetical protein